MIESDDYRAYLKATTATQGDIWDVHTITETWQVEKTALNGAGNVEVGPLEPVSIIYDETQGGPVIKNIGEQYGAGTDWMSGALVRRLVWGMPEGNKITVNVEYGTRYFESKYAKGMAAGEEDIANAEVEARGLFLPCMVIPTFRTRSMKMYRDNPEMTGPNATNDISGSDIGGIQKVRDIDVRQTALRLRFVVDVNSGGIDYLTGVLQAYVGKKNSAAFLGYGPQNLVCDGAAINHLENEFYEVVVDYLYDEYFHHSQILQMDNDGKPRMNGDDYADVRWAREERQSVDFNEIWPDSAGGRSMKYQAFQGVWY